MPLIPPELRQGEEELELARQNKIPNLIEPADIKGDLHIHSNFQFPSSHDLGQSSLKDILAQAQKLNYKYIGIADHNPKFKDLSFKEKKQILEDKKNYLAKTNSKIKIFNGMEIDIRPDGSLALEEELLNTLDYAIASIHSSFDLPQDEQTQRIIATLSHPKVKILGHPTGRLINKRQSINANWEKIFKFCAQNNKILEINSTPARLDLPDDLIKIAIKHKAKLVINTDSHHSSALANIKYGIWTARRGWASAKNVINTYSLKDLSNMLE